MTLLDPAAGLIGAALSIPVLITLYLLRLRRRPLRVSSTLLWDEAVKDMQANVPLRWVRASWLLALQLAALACLLIAIARPAVPGVATVAARTILVIDCSASMSADDAEPLGRAGPRSISRLEMAKSQALAVVDAIGTSAYSSGGNSPGDGGMAGGGKGTGRPMAMVIALGTEARIVCPFTNRLSELSDAIDRIGPTDEPGNLGALLNLLRIVTMGGPAEGVADGVDASRGRGTARVLLFSDGSFDPPEQSRFPGAADLHLVRCGPRLVEGQPPLRPNNLGIAALSARRDTERPGVSRVFARIVNAGAESVETSLQLLVDGKPRGIAAVTAPAAPEHGAHETPGLALGETSITLEVEQAEGGMIELRLARPDLLEADNRAFIQIRKAVRPRVLVVGPGEHGATGAAGDPYAALRGRMGTDRFLLGALEELDLTELRVIDSANYEAEVNAARAEGGPSPRAFARYDLIVFDRVTPRTVPSQPTISIGAGLPINGLRVDAPEPGDQTATRFASWKRTHPIMRSAPLDAVLIAPPMRMTLPQEADSSVGVTVLARGQTDPLIALLQDAGGRAAKRLVLGFDLVRTNWGPDVSFPVFISSAVDDLTGRGEADSGRVLTTGEPVALRPGVASKELRITGPVTLSVPVSSELSPGASLTIGVLSRIGLYTIQGTVPADATLGISLLNPRESELASPGTLPEIAGLREPPPAESAPARRPMREIWPWFVLAATVLLTAEWFVYAWRARL